MAFLVLIVWGFVLFNDLIGKPFEYGGRGPVGYDCYGLAMEVYKRRGINLKEYYSPDNLSIIGNLVEDGKEDFIPLEKPEPFCFVLFRVPKYTTHIGVVLPDCKRFIHVSRGKNVSIERLDHIIWKTKISGYYRCIN